MREGVCMEAQPRGEVVTQAADPPIVSSSYSFLFIHSPPHLSFSLALLDSVCRDA